MGFFRNSYNRLLIVVVGATYALIYGFYFGAPAFAISEETINDFDVSDAARSDYPFAIEMEMDWVWNPGYGFLYFGEYPWVYSEYLRSWYFSASPANNLWMYIPGDSPGQAGAWAYTTEAVFPWMWLNYRGVELWIDMHSLLYSSPYYDGIAAIEDAIDDSDASPPTPSDPTNDEGEYPSEDVDLDINEPISPTGEAQ